MVKSLTFALALLLAVVGAPPAQAAPLTASSEKTVIFVKQTVTQSGVSTVTAKAGPLLTSNKGFGINELSTTVTPGSIAVGLPSISLTGTYATGTGRPTRGMVLDVANSKIKTNFPGLKSSLSGYMKQYGISSGWFNYRQEVEVDANGTVETWTIYWDFFADLNGRGAFADAKLVPPDPKVLYVTYTPLAVDDDLPQDWKYDGAGMVSYQLRDMDFQPLTDWVTVNVGGAYDAPQGAVEYADAGVSCLMDASNSGCSGGAVDVKRLLDSTGAVMAVVDYVRKVEPVWVENADGDMVPKMSTRIDTREVTYNGCMETIFRNKGSFGYTLSTNMGRYLATSSGDPRVVTFQQINEYDGTYLSPTTDYDHSIKIKRSDVTNLTPYAIDPVKKDILLLVKNIPGLISVAPIKVMNVPQTLIGSASGGIWQYGGRDDAYYVTWTLKCNAESEGYAIDTKILNTRHWGAWSSSAVLTSAVSDVGWSAVALSKFDSSRYVAYADMNAGIVRLSDGATSGSYAYRASGGFEGTSSDFVCGHNNYSMQYPGAANYSCENKNVVSYTCGAASKPADYFLNNIFQYRIENMTCTGSTYLRGFYMSNGGPVWETIMATQKDPTTSAVWKCWDVPTTTTVDGKTVTTWANKCDWRIDRTCTKCAAGVEP